MTMLDLVDDRLVAHALQLLEAYGFLLSDKERLITVYKGYTVSKLVAEYERTRSPLLGYVTVATCCMEQKELQKGKEILVRLKSDEAYNRYEKGAKVRDFLSRELTKLLRKQKLSLHKRET